MKHYPEKTQNRKGKRHPDYFDKRNLTASDLELLADFKKRREEYDRKINESNIIHSKETCCGCGFPTFEKGDGFASCIICLWEGVSSEKDDTLRRTPPNYISLLEHRIAISGFLQAFFRDHEINPSVDKVIERINDFLKGDTPVDTNDFANNLKNILPTRPKKDKGP